MYRTSHGNARITFTALEERRRFKPAFKAHLSLLLVLNFPGVLQYHHGWVEVTLDTALGNLSLIVGLTGAAPHQAEIVAGLESKVRSSSHLDTYLQAIAKPGRTILHVHPHPCVIRLVCLWVGGRRRALLRRHYKQAFTRASKRRATGQIFKRAERWRLQSAAAATGLARLEWKRYGGLCGLMLGGYKFYCGSNITHSHSTYRPWLG
ncbi:hypothetical protein PC116_g25073 [Phytophthora cactorum]|uniref:Uncharacterized protein n=1 Tax=Phytophthora cactorum TaxID=29920 RepID=A0A8T1JTU4_9STRA|nr:hypothetical protein PC117_g22938 [Phytophthora cactorum]KAG2974267.1 hypothetical protein PC119_g22722 [Phytophthora cactorum]KAG3128567.1 hypothetical protein C6341_g24496 [Phytophthora cactorum]KAG4226518.1 hypothetical protein PC116_g25073 [Phytophthora cactorum]